MPLFRFILLLFVLSLTAAPTWAQAKKKKPVPKGTTVKKGKAVATPSRGKAGTTKAKPKTGSTTKAKSVAKKPKSEATQPDAVASPLRTMSREQLEQQRTAILDEIKRTQAELSVLQKDKKTTLSQLQALQSKLAARQSLITNINNEIRYIEQNINTTANDISTLKSQLSVLKKQYAEMVRYTYKNKTSSDLVVFLFSSSSFNDALRRFRFVKQYRNYRADQAAKIVASSKQLSNKISVLNLEKQKKDMVLQDQQKQSLILQTETKEKDRVVAELKGREKQLMDGLAKQRKSAESLNRAIDAAIRREIELARKRAMEEKREQERKIAEQKKAETNAVLEKKRREEFERQLALEKKKQEEREKALALAKKEQEEKERLAVVEKQKREELERKLAQEKKDREDRERVLALEKEKREQAERKAAQLADEQRIKKEKVLAREREEQEERQRKLQKERDEQDARQKKLAEQKRLSESQQRELVSLKQRQEEEQRKLAEDKKDRERELARAAQSNTYYNPRYIPELAGKEKPITINNTGTSGGANAKSFEKDDYKFSLTPQEREITNNFEQSRGNLPWPVEKGFIVEHFGKNKHPVFNIVTDNYGIDIKTSRGAKARAIFTGEVASIISIPGTAWQTVVINHGSYFTVYAKLEKVFVSKGAKVNTKQPIGVVITDEEGNTQINFQVWKVGVGGASVKVNPELWIAQ